VRKGRFLLEVEEIDGGEQMIDQKNGKRRRV
jgi:hypothetical protein